MRGDESSIFNNFVRKNVQIRRANICNTNTVTFNFDLYIYDVGIQKRSEFKMYNIVSQHLKF